MRPPSCRGRPGCYAPRDAQPYGCRRDRYPSPQAMTRSCTIRAVRTEARVDADLRLRLHELIDGFRVSLHDSLDGSASRRPGCDSSRRRPPCSGCSSTSPTSKVSGSTRRSPADLARRSHPDHAGSLLPLKQATTRSHRSRPRNCSCVSGRADHVALPLDDVVNVRAVVYCRPCSCKCSAARTARWPRPHPPLEPRPTFPLIVAPTQVGHSSP